jgi:hypothetical protein
MTSQGQCRDAMPVDSSLGNERRDVTGGNNCLMNRQKSPILEEVSQYN